MKAKGKCLFMVLLLVMVVSFPGVAVAQSDEYAGGSHLTAMAPGRV